MSFRVLSLTLLAALAGALPSEAQQIVVLPNGTWANDVTPDGEVVVGTAPGGGFIWRWRVDPAPTFVPGADMVAVSDDGTVVAGTIPFAGPSPETAAIWTAATGWQPLGGLESCDSFLTSAYGISGDGTTIVGLAWMNCHGLGFRWTAATGMVPLQNLANGNNRCSAISSDGTDLGGFAQGTFNRTPAYWAADTTGTVLNPAFRGEVFGFDEDGNLSVGTNYFSGSVYSAFRRNKQTGVMTNLGHLKPTWNGNATDISEGGGVIVGYDHLVFSREAWIWTAASGIVSLNAKLTSLGVTGAPALQVSRACSDDGNVIVGGCAGTPLGTAGFIVDLAPPSAFVSLGQGLAGINGVPALAGTGALLPAAPVTMALSNAKPNGSATLFVGLTAINAPFKQGVLVPHPNFVLGGLRINGAGAMTLPFAWPAGLPSGFSLFWQAWLADAAAPAGFAASNGLKSTTP